MVLFRDVRLIITLTVVLRFKLWVFSWMGLGGVENKEEFNISLTHLLQWLESFKNKGEIQRRNAQFLETFPLRKVALVFFPDRRIV